ncbi:MAG: 30S ribosomal protein S1 [Thermoguttaceae bacterium]
MTEFKHSILIGSQRDSAVRTTQRDVAARGSQHAKAHGDDERATSEVADASVVNEKTVAPKSSVHEDREDVDASSSTSPPVPQPPREKVPVPRRRGKMGDDLEAEFDAIFASKSIDEMMSGVDEIASQGVLEPDTKINGKILRLNAEEVFISLGGRDEGVLSRRGLPLEVELEVGKTLEVTVLRHLADEGLYELSTPLASADVRDWSQVREGLVVECLVTKANTGGLECQVNSLRGFMPISQIALYRVEKGDDYVGQRLTCVVIEADSERRNLVLSRRAMLEREREELREKTKATLEVGQVREGVVRKIIDAGAFVDLGGVDGFIPIGSLAWGRVKHPSDVLSEGQTVRVRIAKIDFEANRISLVYRDDANDPWNDVSAIVEKSIMRGQVTRVMEFGAFVELMPGVEGLVHISELANKRVGHVGEVVSEGDWVDVLVVSVDRASRRVSLSIKSASAAPENVADDGTSTPQKPEPQAAPLKLKPQKKVPLQGGVESRSGDGERFGLKW